MHKIKTAVTHETYPAHLILMRTDTLRGWWVWPPYDEEEEIEEARTGWKVEHVSVT